MATLPKQQMEQAAQLPAEDPMFAETDGDGLPNLLATPEGRKRALQREFENLHRKEGKFKDQYALNQEKLSSMKMDFLRKVYEILRKVGVDPSDQESIRRFLEALQKQDPDLVLLFEVAFNQLAPDEQSPGVPSGPLIPNAAPEMGEAPEATEEPEPAEEPGSVMPPPESPPEAGAENPLMANIRRAQM